MDLWNWASQNGFKIRDQDWISNKSEYNMHLINFLEIGIIDYPIKLSIKYEDMEDNLDNDDLFNSDDYVIIECTIADYNIYFKTEQDAIMFKLKWI